MVCLGVGCRKSSSSSAHGDTSTGHAGGDLDCSQCGCIASMGLAAVGHYKVIGGLTAGHLFVASDKVGEGWRKLQEALSPKPIVHAEPVPFKIMSNEQRHQTSLGAKP